MITFVEARQDPFTVSVPAEAGGVENSSVFHDPGPLTSLDSYTLGIRHYLSIDNSLRSITHFWICMRPKESAEARH